MIDLRTKIKDVPHFPKEGIIFKDITPLLGDAEAFRQAIEQLAAPYLENPPDVVVGVESRGFIFSAPLAHRLKSGLVPIRKFGKLPRATFDEAYDLEYGRSILSLHQDAIHRGQKVLIVDDLLATGGTLSAVLKLLRKIPAEVIGIAFLIELSFLKGRESLPNVPIHSLITY